MKPSNQSKKSKKLEPQIETNVEIPPKEVSEKRKESSKEFIDARFLHDRFCKFEIPFEKEKAILAMRQIMGVVPLEVVKNAELPFKLNSLYWFLTPKGKEFLQSQQKRYQLDKKLAELDLNKIVLG